MPAKTLKELVDLAKAKPGQVSFAYASTSQQVSSEMLASMAGIKMNPMPYKSGPAAMTDLIGGQVMMFTADFAVTVPQHKAGKIRGLAVTSTKRAAAVPELPTVNEALGHQGLRADRLLRGVRAGRHAARGDRQAEPGDQRRGRQQGRCQDKFAANGFAVEPGTPEALAQRNKAETAKWEKAIRDAKIEPQ